MEFNDTQIKIIDLFIGAYGRTPTLQGLNFFTEKVESGEMSFEEISEYLFTNEEAKDRFPQDVPIEDKINAVFKNVLGREVKTKEGMDFLEVKTSSRRVLFSWFS